MTFEEYQKKAKTTALYSTPAKQMICSGISLVTELEEYLDKLCLLPNIEAKALKDELGDCLWGLALFADHIGITRLKYIKSEDSIYDLPSTGAKFLEKIKKTVRDFDFIIPDKYMDDIIDFLYIYYSAIQDEIERQGWTIVNIMELNLTKLKDRAERNTLSGDGDER